MRPLPPDQRRPLVGRFPPDTPGYDAAIEAHERAIEAGQPGYLDPTSGAFVFTAAAHWERGTCCRSGCRHCPFELGERADCCASGCAGCPFTAHVEDRRTG
jgi:hypothetical protein